MTIKSPGSSRTIQVKIYRFNCNPFLKFWLRQVPLLLCPTKDASSHTPISPSIPELFHVDVFIRLLYFSSIFWSHLVDIRSSLNQLFNSKPWPWKQYGTRLGKPISPENSSAEHCPLTCYFYDIFISSAFCNVFSGFLIRSLFSYRSLKVLPPVFDKLDFGIVVEQRVFFPFRAANTSSGLFFLQIYYFTVI